jgi:hypothetical protein
MAFQFVSGRKGEITEHATDVCFFHVFLQEFQRCKSNSTCSVITAIIAFAFLTPKFEITMLSLDMSL